VDEYTAGTSPTNNTDFLHATQASREGDGIHIRFPAKPSREYAVWYENESLVSPDWSNATPIRISVPFETIYDWVDDGSTTVPALADMSKRFYQIRVQLPQ